MSSVIYVVPWAICDTESIYVKKVRGEETAVPEKGGEFHAWSIRDVIPSPDRRTKDIYAIVDVFNGYKDKMNEKGMSVFALTNSPNVLTELGFEKASESEAAFIRERVLKLNKSKKK